MRSFLRVSPAKSNLQQGFSLLEVLVAVAIIGILAAVAISSMSGTLTQTQAAIASNSEETLNTAVHRYNEVNGELIYTPTGTGSDELTILRTLQYRNPINPTVGSPYIVPNWNPVESSNTNDYRLAWQGTLFTLLNPGESGTGLRVAFDGSDMSTPYVFPSGYTPVAGQ